MNNLDSLVPLYSKMSPRSKGDNALKYVTDSLNKKDISPGTAFRMADLKGQGFVSAEGLVRSFHQLDSELNITLVN